MLQNDDDDDWGIEGRKGRKISHVFLHRKILESFGNKKIPGPGEGGIKLTHIDFKKLNYENKLMNTRRVINKIKTNKQCKFWHKNSRLFQKKKIKFTAAEKNELNNYIFDFRLKKRINQHLTKERIIIIMIRWSTTSTTIKRVSTSSTTSTTS